VAESIAAAEKWRLVEDGHVTRAVGHRGQHLKEGGERL